MTTVNDYRLICWALGAHVLLKDALSSKLGQMWVLAKEHLHQEALFFIFSIFKYACSASSFFFLEWLWVEKQTCILHQFKGSLSEKLFGYQLHHHLTITFRTASICLTEVHFTRGNPGWWKWGAVTTPNRIWVFSHHVVVFLESGLVWSRKGDTVHTNCHGC